MKSAAAISHPLEWLVIWIMLYNPQISFLLEQAHQGYQ
jgi:hypothetical protein